MSTKLGSVPIVECAAGIRSLATDAHNTHRAFAEVQRHILRTSDPLKPSDLPSAWRTYTEAYVTIVRSSDAAATKLASNINMYLSLQGDLEEDDTEDMIEELSALVKDLPAVPTNMSTSCAELRNRVETCLLGLTNSTLPTNVDGSCSITASTSKVRSETGPTPGTANANEASRRVWGRAFGALAAFQQPEDTKSVLNRVARAPSQGWGDIAGVVSAAQNMWAGPYATTNGQSTTASDSRTVPPPAKPATGADETLVGLIKSVLENLATQVPKFNAFSEVSKHLENELNAYKSAFQAVKTYPTAEKRTALQNMHTRVAASARLWNQLAVVLTDGYARVQK
ncbi:hypothetical protein VTO73DRAFT_10424 [Trametes versicolor]